MATPRVSNRYPRPGERIAPSTLREFLKGPIPAELRGSVGTAGLRLCDLDETAWQRLTAETILQLSKLVVQRVAAEHSRKSFLDRHFPRPAPGTTLDELRLENRTRRCLVREGFDENPEVLGDHTIGEIMAIRSFGPRCLVDLLAALESVRKLEASPAAEASAEGNELSAELTAAARRLAALPAAESVRREDPRFVGLIHSVDVEARTARELAERLIARAEDPPDAPYAAGQARQLCHRIEVMPKLTLEQELTEIFANTPSERNRQIVIGYYGWEDGRQHTLTEIGARFGVTRERIRQLCAKLTKRHKNVKNILAPVMERALELIERQIPCRAAALEAELARQRLTAVGMKLEGVAAGARLLGRPVRVKVVRLDPHGADGGRVAVRPEQADAALAVVDVARKEIYFHGLATVEKTADLVSQQRPGSSVHTDLVREALKCMSGFSWLDEQAGWFRLLPIGKHGLSRTIDKILAVAGEVTVSEMRTAIGRNRRLWEAPPPENVLLEFCRQTPGVRVEGQRIIADPPRDWREALGGVEHTLVAVLKEHGPIMERGAMEDLCVAAGMNRFSFHAFVSWSPVIVQLGHSVYGLLGGRPSQRAIDELIATRRAKRPVHRVLDSHGRTADGKIWLSYRLSKAASTYAVITVPAALKKAVRGRFTLLSPEGEKIGMLATRDGRAWGLGAYLRRRGARIGDCVVLTLDLSERSAVVALQEQPAEHGRQDAD